jgi:hypothetical protein
VIQNHPGRAVGHVEVEASGQVEGECLFPSAIPVVIFQPGVCQLFPNGFEPLGEFGADGSI